MNEKLRSVESGFQARGTGLSLMLVFSAPERAQKSSTIFRNIFLRKSCAHRWLVSHGCAAMPKGLFGPERILKSMPYKCIGGAKKVAVTSALAVKEF